MDAPQSKLRAIAKKAPEEGQLNTVSPTRSYVISGEMLNAVLKTYENLNLPYKVLYTAIEELKNLPEVADESTET